MFTVNLTSPPLGDCVEIHFIVISTEGRNLYK